MRTLIAFLLLANVAVAQKPKPPFSNPNEPDDAKLKLEYSGDTTVPKSGKVVIPFFGKGEFAYEPGCSFSGATIPGERPRVSALMATLKAKPGKLLHYDCRGVKREDAGETRKD
jgi:hypothetical protein